VVKDEDKGEHSLLQSCTLTLTDLPTHRTHHPHTHAPFSSLGLIIFTRREKNHFPCKCRRNNVMRGNVVARKRRTRMCRAEISRARKCRATSNQMTLQ
jgi:hypothetical protein